MSTVIPGFPHSSVERLCDYELPEQPGATPALDPPDSDGPENLALAWWLWMDELGRSMLKHYDAWREQLDRATSTTGRDHRG